MSNSKIDIHLNKNSILFILYLRVLCLYLNTGPLNIKVEKSRISLSFKNLDSKNKFNLIKFLFKPFNFFDVNKVVTTY